MNSKKINNEDIRKHFDAIANSYDYYKKKNSYYYDSIKSALKKVIIPKKRVLDFGCGTGEILAFLNPKYGLGIDLSPRLIKIARKKYKSDKNLIFKVASTPTTEKFDYIIMIDVVEHLSNPDQTFKEMSKFSSKNTKLIISFVSEKWEILLEILEKIKFKMPEGPNKRVSKEVIIKLAKSNGFYLKKELSIAPLPHFLIVIKPALEKLKLAPITFLVFERL